MTQTLLILLVVTCGGLLAWGFQKPRRMLEYPFLAGAVFSGWVLPQLVGLSANPDRFPPGALAKGIFMTLLCALACYGGYYLNKRPMAAFNWPFDRRRLLISATVLSLAGAYFFFRVSELAEEVVGLWSGIITVFVFFSSMLTVGMAIALATYGQHPSRWALGIIAFDLCFYIHRIVFLGRRQFAIELFIMLGMVLWFRYRKLPPRALVATALVIGTLWINSIGAYRATVIGEESPGFDEVMQIDFVGNLQRIATEGGQEITNMVYNIEAYDRRGNFDLGLSHWNSFVHLYVPGQFIGFDTKRSLMLSLDDAAYSLFGHIPASGSTSTGISDAFLSFWYFGAVKFLIIGYIMHSLSRAADRGQIVAQILLMLIFPGSLLAITHHTDWFFMAWIRIAAFLGPAIWYSKSKTLPFLTMSLPIRTNTL
jgi:hypothetical protein